MKYIGYVEISVGVGLGLGPTIGSIIFTYSDYQWTMYAFGAINFFALILCMVLIPSVLNNSASEEEIEEYEDDYEDYMSQYKGKKDRLKISAWTILSDKSTVFALLICMVGTFNITYWSGFVSLELQQMGMNPNNVGYVLGAQSVTYIVACLVYPYTIEHSPRMLQFSICLLGFAVCNLLLGPSIWLNFPDNVWLPILSFPIQGIM